MYNFIIKTTIESIKGFQQFNVNAKNLKEAIEIINKIVGDDINITEDIIGIEVKEIEKKQDNESND